MNLRRRQLRILCEVEREVADSEPGLYAFFLSFNRRAVGREMPPTERMAPGPLRRLARWRQGRAPTDRMTDWCAENWND